MPISRSQCPKSHFPRATKGQSQLPFYPFRTLFIITSCRAFLCLSANLNSSSFYSYSSSCRYSFCSVFKEKKSSPDYVKLWYHNDGKSSVKAISVVSFNSKVLKSDRITFIIWFSTKNKPSLDFLVIKQSFTASREILGRAIGYGTPNIRRRGSTAMQRVLKNVCQIKSTPCLVEVNWGSALIWRILTFRENKSAGFLWNSNINPFVAPWLQNHFHLPFLF